MAITKSAIYEPLERVQSAKRRLLALGIIAGRAVAAQIEEIIARDLDEAEAKLEYAMEIAE